ncbi:UNVERIFIED_CONTAM: hypothetical protein FKN15_003071 [Acipenser sinensis]
MTVCPRRLDFAGVNDEGGREVISFEFQKLRYWYDGEERKRFVPVAFPVEQPFGFFHTWKGYQEESELRTAEKKYGMNKYVPKRRGGQTLQERFCDEDFCH